MKGILMSVSGKWPTSSPCTRITLREHHLKVKCSTSHFKHCAAAWRSGRRRPEIMKIMTFSIFARIRFWRPTLASSGTSALQDRDSRLAPSFPEWLKVFFETLRFQNKLQDVQLRRKDCSKWRPPTRHLSFRSVSGKSPTSSPCTRITLREQHLKVKCSTSQF